MKDKKSLSRRQAIRELRERIGELKDAHKIMLRKDVTPLMKRLAVLEAAERLRRAERALVKSVEGDRANPQLELLSLPIERAANEAARPTRPGASGNQLVGDAAPLFAQPGAAGKG